MLPSGSRRLPADSTPNGLVTFGASASAPGRNISETVFRDVPATAIHAAHHQRHDAGRPLGKRRTRKVPGRTMEGSQIQFSTHAVYSPPGSEPGRVWRVYTLYSPTKTVSPRPSPIARQIQPTELPGRREETRVPTSEKARPSTRKTKGRFSVPQSSVSGAERLRSASTTDAATSRTESAPSEGANREAARARTGPPPRPAPPPTGI